MYIYDSKIRPAQYLAEPDDIAIRIIYDTIDDLDEWPDDLTAEITDCIEVMTAGESIEINGVTVTRLEDPNHQEGVTI